MAKLFDGSFGMKTVAVGLVVGILLVVVGMSGVLDRDSTSEVVDQTTEVERLETRLRALLGGISGVTDVRVMVHASDDGRVEYSTSGGDVVCRSSPEIVGVAVVCRGISEVEQSELVMLISSLFGLSTKNVYVAAQ